MKWRGETESQWRERVSKWHTRYALIPMQMSNGTWVWLEEYYVRIEEGYKPYAERRTIEDFHQRYVKINGEFICRNSVSRPQPPSSLKPPPPRI